MSIVTNYAKTVEAALQRIEKLEAEKANLELEKAHLLKVIKERKLAGYISNIGKGFFRFDEKDTHSKNYKPVYYISDEFDAAGFLITPEVKIEQ